MNLISITSSFLSVAFKEKMVKKVFDPFKPIFTQQIQVKLVAIDIEFNLISAYTPFHFSRSLPLMLISLDD